MSEPAPASAPPAADLNNLVHPGDLLAAVKTLFGPSASILAHEVKQGTETVQGFASLMLRVKVKVQVNQHETVETSLMVKRKPVVAAHAEMLDAMGGVNLRESTFFNQILPLLEEKAGQLPLVRPLVAHTDAILMEDLCLSGYNTLSKSFLDIGRGGAVTLPVARSVVRKLGKFHAASLGRDWTEAMPGFFDQDPAMEGVVGEQFRVMISNTLLHTVLPVIKKFYSDFPNLQKYLDFLEGPYFFDTAAKIAKDRSFSPCAVLHGDCWLNNMMFKVDPTTKKVIDLKFIDLQIVRFGAPALDLIYFLYSCTGADFRKQHETEILRTYVDAFNCEANETPDLMNFDKFVESYEKSRYFGVAMSMTFRPIQFLTFFAPPEGGELSAEFFEMAAQPSNWIEPTIKAYEEDEMVKNEFNQLILHAFEVIKKFVEID